MYETRTFILSESIKVSDLLTLLKNVSDRFLIETVKHKEMIESLKNTIKRAEEHAYAIYHQVNSRLPEGCYYEFGLMNCERLGIIGALEFSSEMEHRSPSIITKDVKIDGFVLYSTVPSWKSIFTEVEQKKVFDDLVLLITSELTKIHVNIKEIKSESK